jgi:hypothetical protein
MCTHIINILYVSVSGLSSYLDCNPGHDSYGFLCFCSFIAKPLLHKEAICFPGLTSRSFFAMKHIFSGFNSTGTIRAFISKNLRGKKRFQNDINQLEN